VAGSLGLGQFREAGRHGQRWNIGREGKANTIAMRNFPGSSYTGVSVGDRRAVVNALCEDFNEVRCAFSSGPEGEWTLD